jgi:hypothetical protein
MHHVGGGKTLLAVECEDHVGGGKKMYAVRRSCWRWKDHVGGRVRRSCRRR